MTKTHSPGPWRVGYESRYIVDADNTTIIHDINPTDAALIAAAPEMLNSLNVIRDRLKYWHSKRLPFYGHEGFMLEFSAELKILDEIIAKAEGNVKTETE